MGIWIIWTLGLLVWWCGEFISHYSDHLPNFPYCYTGSYPHFIGKENRMLNVLSSANRETSVLCWPKVKCCSDVMWWGHVQTIIIHISSCPHCPWIGSYPHFIEKEWGICGALSSAGKWTSVVYSSAGKWTSVVYSSADKWTSVVYSSADKWTSVVYWPNTDRCSDVMRSSGRRVV